MPVLINEFEAVAEPPNEPRGETTAGNGPRRIKPVELGPPLRFLALRAARVRAH
jgi:hypothetical protein